MAGRRQVSATARRHGISRSQLVTWRDLAREGRLIDGSDAAPCDAPTFTPVVLAADPPATPTRIDAVFDIERAVNGMPADQRLAVRRAEAAPLVAALREWMTSERARLSKHAPVAKAMDYMLT
jgi:transposase-like protein